MIGHGLIYEHEFVGQQECLRQFLPRQRRLGQPGLRDEALGQAQLLRLRFTAKRGTIQGGNTGLVRTVGQALSQGEVVHKNKVSLAVGQALRVS